MRIIGLALPLCALVLFSGCRSDCELTEATGTLAAWGDSCSAAVKYSEQSMSFDIDRLNAERLDLYKTMNFSAGGPFYPGRRVSSGVGISAERFAMEATATGFVDFVVDSTDFRTGGDEYVFITIVNLEVRDRVTSEPGHISGRIKALNTTVKK